MTVCSLWYFRSLLYRHIICCRGCWISWRPIASTSSLLRYAEPLEPWGYLFVPPFYPLSICTGSTMPGVVLLRLVSSNELDHNQNHPTGGYVELRTFPLPNLLSMSQWLPRRTKQYSICPSGRIWVAAARLLTPILADPPAITGPTEISNMNFHSVAATRMPCCKIRK